MVEIASNGTDSTSVKLPLPKDIYRLTPAQLKVPEREEEKEQWFAWLIAHQQEGISFGIRPHMPPNFPNDAMLNKWRSEVWKVYTDIVYGKRFGDNQAGSIYHSPRYIDTSI